MEEERAFNLNKSGSLTPEAISAAAAGGGGVAGAAPSSTASPNVGPHGGVVAAHEVPHAPAVSERVALRKLEAEKRRNQAIKIPST